MPKALLKIHSEDIAKAIKQTGQDVPEDLRVGQIWALCPDCEGMENPGVVAVVESATFKKVPEMTRLPNVSFKGLESEAT